MEAAREPPAEDRSGRWTRPALVGPIGFAALAIVNAVAITAVVPWPHGGLGMRLAHHAVDAAELLSMGLWLAVLLGAAARLLPRRAALAAYVLVSTGVMHLVLGQDLERQATVMGGRWRVALYVVYLILCGLAVPAAHVIGALLARYRRLFLVPTVAAVGGMVVNHLVLRDDYPGVHAAVGWAAATMLGAGLAERAAALLLPRLRSGRVRGIASGAALAAMVVALLPPPNDLRLELFKQPGAIGAWLYALTLWRPPPASAAPPSSPWLADRSQLAPLPPTVPRLSSEAPLVVMISIDALRADAIADAANDARFPTFAAMKRSGAYFTRASAPGAQTAVSLTAAFSGRYFSQLRWELHGEGSARFAYASSDPTPRFPELLAARSVRTVSFLPLLFLVDEYGVLRGFTEENMVTVGRRHAAGKAVVDPLLERLRRVGDEPTFLYGHLMEPHYPYDRGGNEGTPRERYLAEIAVADGLLARVVRLLGQRFANRAYLIVTADHGEAFGEHGTFQHTKTLYEELLHVPLLISGPGVVPRRIEQHVGLLDIGPTVLDLFGAETPAEVIGQSLVPLLAGGDAALDRPVLAEGRLRSALYHGDLKVIEDARRKTVEVFDLSSDPAELDNLFDRDRARAEPALARLRAFFTVHALSSRDPSYSAPYKP